MSEQENERVGTEEEAEVEGHGIRRPRGEEGPTDAGERRDDDADVEGHSWRKP